jgi:hypothetical protein
MNDNFAFARRAGPNRMTVNIQSYRVDFQVGDPLELRGMGKHGL